MLPYCVSVLLMLLIAGGGAVYWFFVRPQAQVSGTLAAPVKKPVSIARDAAGVPHIRASSVADALFAQGFVHAQDRLFQMDLTRRQAAGELAEVFGPSAVGSDLTMRRLRLRRLAEAHGRNLPGAERDVLAAYVDGVNYFINTRPDRLPVEFSRLRYGPAPWSITDSLVTFLSMAYAMTNTWRDELTKHALSNAGDTGKVDVLYPNMAGGALQPGSNAWVVSGRFTASGKPLLANDPHVALSLPGLWYANHLQAPGLDVTGISLPGVPAVIIGHNDRISWGITNLQGDVQDLYAERMDTSGERGLGDTSAGARVEEETVRVRGGPPVPLTIRSTPHGPVVHADSSRRLALRWTAAEPGLRFPLLALNQASTWAQFRAAIADWQHPPQNFVYADVDGNIGYQVAGLLPIREGHVGDLPVEGTVAQPEWAGFIPFDRLPSAFNPAAGMAITANQNPFPPDFRYPVHGNFAPLYRARQIQARLSGRTSLLPSDMMTIQQDVYSSFLHFLAREVVVAVKGKSLTSPLLLGAVGLLEKWDGQMEASRAAPLVITLIWDRVRVAVANRAAPAAGQAYDSQMAPAVVERLLRERPHDWFADYDEMLTETTVAALEAGAKAHGNDPAGWSLGRVQKAQMSNPIFGGMSILRGPLGFWTRLPTTGLSGSPTSVHQITPGLAPSMRMVVDLGALDASLLTLPTGQSGQMLSPHYKDQWNAYINGKGLPMRFLTVDAIDVLTLTPIA